MIIFPNCANYLSVEKYRLFDAVQRVVMNQVLALVRTLVQTILNSQSI